MHIEEIDLYKVACHVSRKDMKLEGITVDDLVNRSPLAHMFFRKAAELSKGSTDYDWPGCALSMTMDFYPTDIVITFSERIDDYLYNLKQSALALPEGSAEQLNMMITAIEQSDEEEARTLIRRFEQNVRDIQ